MVLLCQIEVLSPAGMFISLAVVLCATLAGKKLYGAITKNPRKPFDEC